MILQVLWKAAERIAFHRSPRMFFHFVFWMQEILLSWDWVGKTMLDNERSFKTIVSSVERIGRNVENRLSKIIACLHNESRLFMIIISRPNVQRLKYRWVQVLEFYRVACTKAGNIMKFHSHDLNHYAPVTLPSCKRERPSLGESGRLSTLPHYLKIYVYL